MSLRPTNGRGRILGLNRETNVQRLAAYKGSDTAYPSLTTVRYKCYAPLMGRNITQRELRNDSGTVLREVQAGQTLIVTRNGVPVAELRPVPPRRFVPRAVIADAARRAPRVDANRLRADLDALVDQGTGG